MNNRILSENEPTKESKRSPIISALLKYSLHEQIYI